MGGVRGVLALLIIITGKPASGTFLGWRRCLILQVRQRSDVTSILQSFEGTYYAGPIVVYA